MEQMEQRSASWHSFRSKRIGGSDAPIVCGQSPWKTAFQLFEEKTGRRPQPDLSDNFAVQRGIRLEPMVRAMCELLLDMDLPDDILVHPEKAYMMASLDGWNKDARVFLEMKVGNKKDHDAIIVPEGAIFCEDQRALPAKYFPQVQHQLYVTGAPYGVFASYYISKGQDESRGNLKLVKCLRDDEWLSRYLPLADRFYECLVNGTEPLDLKLGF